MTTSETNRADGGYELEVVNWEVSKLKIHPELRKCGCVPSEEQIVSMQRAGRALFDSPLEITPGGHVIDDGARLMIAERLGIEKVTCVVRVLNAREALKAIIQKSFQKSWLNDFRRVELALSIKELLREEWQIRQAAEKCAAKAGDDLQNFAGDCYFDIRKEISNLTGVSPFNVSKVQLILSEGCARVVDGSRFGKISIHLAWKLSGKSQDSQREILSTVPLHLDRKVIKREIAKAIGNLNTESEAFSAAIKAVSKLLVIVDNQHVCTSAASFLKVLKKEAEKYEREKK